jgi:hypothetical protein
MTTAQKNNAVKFKKAIAIRKKIGCSLKEAFAQVYGTKKVGAVKKKAAPKKKVAKKKAAPKTLKYRGTLKSEGSKKMYKYSLGAVKKKAAPKNKISTHKDTKSHNVNIRVVSGINGPALANVSYLMDQINKGENQFEILKNRKKKDKILVGFDLKLYQRYPAYIRSLKKQLSEAKKHIK